MGKVETLSRVGTQGIALEDVERRIAQASRALGQLAGPDGHWCFELEADATIPSEYVLYHHFRGSILAPTSKPRSRTTCAAPERAAWRLVLVHEGGFDMSCSVKAYFALKMIGDPPEAPHMARARDAILSRGGAAHANVFARTCSRSTARCRGRRCR